MTTPDYSRGDALITQGPLTTSNVAEAFLGGAAMELEPVRSRSVRRSHLALRVLLL
jgi:hypothetical protein